MSADLAMAEARDAVGQLRDSTPDNVADPILRLFDGRAWLALGHKSWADLGATELRSFTASLSAEQHRGARSVLRAEGMTNRAISSALGRSDRSGGAR